MKTCSTSLVTRKMQNKNKDSISHLPYGQKNLSLIISNGATGHTYPEDRIKIGTASMVNSLT